MELMTEELKKKFEKYPIGSQEELLGKAKVIAKYFNPTGVGTWLITEADKLPNGDYEMFGYCHLGDDDMAEIGYVMLSELQNLRVNLGLTIERDLYISEDIELVDAIKRNGFKVPRFLIENEIEQNDITDEMFD